MLGTSADLKVSPAGTYIVATQSFGGGDGAREFAPSGLFLRQYGAGWIRGAATVPGYQLWTGGVGSSSINVFDILTGDEAGTIPVAGLSGVFSMYYSSSTNTTLLVDRPASAILEVSLSGDVVRTFTTSGMTGVAAAVRGPSGDIFATDGDQHVVRWHANGVFAGLTTLPEEFLGYGVVWAGNVPEPATVSTLVLSTLLVTGRRVRRWGT